MVYCSPSELRKVLDEAIAIYNRTPHEALDNVSPNDVYAGRKEVVLQRRKEKKRLTLERRKHYNLNTKNEDSDQPQGANLVLAKSVQKGLKTYTLHPDQPHRLLLLSISWLSQ